MDSRRVRAVVRGVVQGVSYRASARAEAQRRGLVGWVRNVPDGSVELEAEGPSAALDAFLDWCRRGPPLSEVTSVEVEERPPLAAEKIFRIAH